MSLIGSVRDGLQELRKKSLSQERSIDRSGEFSHWRMSDATGVSVVEKTMGVLILPLVLFWGLIFAVFSVGLGISLLGFKVMGRFFR